MPQGVRCSWPKPLHRKLPTETPPCGILRPEEGDVPWGVGVLQHVVTTLEWQGNQPERRSSRLLNKRYCRCNIEERNIMT